MKTLKTLFVCTIIFISFHSINAQVKIGLLGGLNFSDLNIKDFTSTQSVENQTDFSIGIVLELSINDKFSFVAQPTYKRDGGTVKPGGIDPDIKLETSSIEIPLLLKYQFGEYIKPYIIAGPSVGYTLSNDIEANIAGIIFTSNIDDITEKLTFNLCIGTGIDIPLNNVNLFVETKYNFGLTNLSKDGDVVFKAGALSQTFKMNQIEHEYKYRGFQVSAGMTIEL